MANILKCKMCGGDIEVSQDMTVGKCLFCGSTMTLPRIDSEKKARLFNRANEYRLNNEFDKAYNAYKAIVEEDVTEAEGYWGMVLSEYGVEYVEDPKTGKRVPTCHRTRLQPIMSSVDYKQAIKYADAERKFAYQDEAEQLNKLQKEIMAISSREEPYDVFICYKETDDSTGERTKDSVLAQDIYDALTAKGIRTFFARISLEDKLGQNYEPFIFSALSSAKVMVHVTTSEANCDAVWVKNEWSRYIDFMSEDKSKTLIPVYQDMSPYELPDQMQKLQAQDMSKVGAIQDLVRGIQKLVGEVQIDANQEVLQSIVKERLEKEAEKKRQEEIRRAEEERKATLQKEKEERTKEFWKKNGAKIIFLTVFAIVSVVMIIKLPPFIKYNKATSLYKHGEFSRAVKMFEELEGYKNSDEMKVVSGCYYLSSLLDNKDYTTASKTFYEINENDEMKGIISESKDLKDLHSENEYRLAVYLFNEGQVEESQYLFEDLGVYQDSEERKKDCDYCIAIKKLNENDIKYVINFLQNDDIRDSDREMLKKDIATYILKLYDNSSLVSDYSDVLNKYDILEGACEESPKLYFSMGNAAANCGRWDQAIRFYQKADGVEGTEEKMLEAKYQFCRERKESISDSVGLYLDELYTEKYKDSAVMREIYLMKKNLVGIWQGNGMYIEIANGNKWQGLYEPTKKAGFVDNYYSYSFDEDEKAFIFTSSFSKRKYKGTLSNNTLTITLIDAGIREVIDIRTGTYYKIK